MDWINIAVDIILSITVFALGYYMGRDKGFLDGYEKAANEVADLWKDRLNETGEED